MESDMEVMSTNDSGTNVEENIYRMHILVFDAFLLTLVLVGNISVLVVIINDGQKSRMNVYIKNLAVADLLCGLFYIVPRIVVHVNNDQFYGGNTICKMQEYFGNVGILGSNTIVVALSLDRLYLVLRPLGSLAVRGRSAMMPCILCWVIAAIVSVTGPIVFEYNDVYKYCMPWLDRTETKIYFTTIFVVVFIIPTMILAVCYSVIAYIIWRVSKREGGIQLKENPSSGHQHSTLLNSRQSSHSSGSEQRDTTISKSQIKTIKMTFVIVIAFFCCWAPYMIVNLLFIFGIIIIPDQVSIFINGLLPLNSVVNPLIYAAFSSRVFKRFRNKLTRRLPTTRTTRRTENWKM
uniref:G-protein coupled receptors family 1 profile domain-containing protein n=1 Tax=Magallana gigas TaxID=29159 RepID=A0A8W8LJ70_MAGGI|nr:mesotocin receptor-like [Crassostrea gigas]